MGLTPFRLVSIVLVGIGRVFRSPKDLERATTDMYEVMFEEGVRIRQIVEA
jgi:hypothetical protein